MNRLGFIQEFDKHIPYSFYRHTRFYALPSNFRQYFDGTTVIIWTFFLLHDERVNILWSKGLCSKVFCAWLPLYWIGKSGRAER